MSTLPVWGSLSVKGNLESETNKFLTGDVRPLSPAVQDTAGNYTLDSFSSTVYRSCEYLIQISQGGNFAVVRIIILHNNVSVFLSEYGRIEPIDTGVEFFATLVNGLVSLSYSQPALNTEVKSLGTFLNH